MTYWDVQGIEMVQYPERVEPRWGWPIDERCPWNNLFNIDGPFMAQFIRTFIVPNMVPTAL